ncbi:MAG: Na+/H+ antiporter NhaC family protein [Candidatus Aminicenantia bacterium]
MLLQFIIIIICCILMFNLKIDLVYQEFLYLYIAQEILYKSILKNKKVNHDFGQMKSIFKLTIIFVFLAGISCLTLFSQEVSRPEAENKLDRFEIVTSSFVLKKINFRLEIIAYDSRGQILSFYNGVPQISGVMKRVNGKITSVEQPFENGKLIINKALVEKSGKVIIKVTDQDVTSEKKLRSIPGILSILPPLIAIALALIVRQVTISLFAGIWLGAIFIFDYDVLGGIFRVVDYFAVNALNTTTHIQIIIFSVLFGGMVGVISRNGGTLGIANLITRFSRTSRGGQIAAWVLSIVLFFDDYSSVLITGNLMKPITDRLRVSREKLSFIVDAGAAAVTSIFIISTWIGYEIGLIESGLKSIGFKEDAYSVFIKTIPFRFYPIFVLFLVFIIAFLNRDFGPMLSAERRARKEGKVIRDGAQLLQELDEAQKFIAGDKPARWFNGLIPIVVVILVALFGLYYTGKQNLIASGDFSFTIGNIISHSDSYRALLWASFSGCLVAILMTLFQRLLKLAEAIEAWFNGIKSMLLAVLILILAWSISLVTEELHTADYLVQILRGNLQPEWLPALTFIISAIISFATGTSWGTMAIIMPLIIPLGYSLGVDAGFDQANLNLILYGVISSVLAGAVFGDHCSPISDTTVLSSMSSTCDHIDHVRTQLPYAILAAIVGVLIGDIPTAYGFPAWVSIIIGFSVLTIFVYFYGKKVDNFKLFDTQKKKSTSNK